MQVPVSPVSPSPPLPTHNRYQTKTDTCQGCGLGTEFEGYDCAQGGTTTATTPMLSGFWRVNTNSDTLLTCRRSEFCLGDSCREGHEGAYCSKCTSKYFESVTAHCMPCIGSPAMTFGVSIGAVCALLLMMWAFKRCVYKRMSKRSRRRFRATLKIVFVFLQVLVALPSILDMQLPPIFKDILLWAKLPALSFVLDNLGVSCFIPTNFYWYDLSILVHAPIHAHCTRNTFVSCVACLI